MKNNTEIISKLKSRVAALHDLIPQDIAEEILVEQEIKKANSLLKDLENQSKHTDSQTLLTNRALLYKASIQDCVGKLIKIPESDIKNYNDSIYKLNLYNNLIESI